jgi:hypothetical protein
MNLAKLIHEMTGDERIEEVLEELCREHIRRWDPGLLGEQRVDRGPDAPKKPVPHVEPHYARIRNRDKAAAYSDKSREGHDVAGWQGQADLIDPLLSEEQRGAVNAANEREWADRELAALMQLTDGGMHLCIAEDANSGKTIFSYRLAAFLASESGRALFNGRAPLVARWENRLGSRSWPRSGQDLRQELHRLVNAAAGKAGIDAEEVVQYAL